ncbi:MAG: hypothetical protein ACOWWM_03515 [Desulfobacterales bacterium]
MPPSAVPTPARRGRSRFGLFEWLLVLAAFAVAGCQEAAVPEASEPAIPHGYVERIEILHEGRLLGFGPFVGYYFRPPDPSDLSRLKFVCFNIENFYTLDLPAHAQLFRGEALFRVLPDNGAALPGSDRINPVFFEEAPPEWLATRPTPMEEFVHFHSCYDAQGPSRAGYWLRHVGLAEFTYDMGGRVGPGSPLYHAVIPGPDGNFARIVEFDRGPGVTGR